MKSVILSIACFTLITLSSFGQNNYPAQGIVTDIDHNAYKTVKIGSQVWTAENLKVSRYRNGDIIPTSLNDEQWEKIEMGAWSYYNNDTALGKTYGKLYNWYAASDQRGLCPAGWHVPSKEEFQILSDYFGGDTIAGAKLTSSEDEGLEALAAGYRFFTGKYKHLDNFTGFWSSTEAGPDFAWIRFLHFKNDPELYLKFFGKKNGFSCRCVKD